MTLFTVQSTIALVLGIAALALEVYAFIEALRHRADAYPAAGKLNKPAWCGITGVAMLIGIVFVQNPLNLFGIIAVVAAGVFLADVRPALQRVLGRGSSDGPYGPWRR
ncbi:DUF2516 family protein [Dermacoccaceae bacterium W4C1]